MILIDLILYVINVTFAWCGQKARSKLVTDWKAILYSVIPATVSQYCCKFYSHRAEL